jgi:hypothetical protein
MNQTTILNRLSMIEAILKSAPNMWAGPKAGYKAERTKLQKELYKLNGNTCPSCGHYKKWGGYIECYKCSH